MPIASPIDAASNVLTPKSRLESRRPTIAGMATPAHAAKQCQTNSLGDNQSTDASTCGSERDADTYFACSACSNERKSIHRCRALKVAAPRRRRKQAQRAGIAAQKLYHRLNQAETERRKLPGSHLCRQPHPSISAPLLATRRMSSAL